jgi:deoxyribodipyrimidine photo-lyase
MTVASNQPGWQWVADSGIVPAPFFRIFNPVTQGEKFDPRAERAEALRRYEVVR